MASTSRTPSDMHGLTASQLSELQGAVQALDTYLLLCVDDLRNNRWDRSNAKHVADCLVRELVRNVGHRFQVDPNTDTIALDHRSKLLTRRVRAVMRAFNKNRNYLSEKPNITWDDSFVPPELYDELASLDGKVSQRAQKGEKKQEKDKASEKMEEQMSKEKVKSTQNDKRKRKETAQENDDTENPRRKWMRKTSESSLVFDIAEDSEEGTSADEDEPPAKRFKRKNSIDDVGIIPVPPCKQCTSSQKECIPNGWSAACKSCRKARQTCSLSKGLRSDKGKAKETAEDNEKPDDTEKPKTQRLREIHTSIYALTKSILDNRSIEDEDDVDQLDEVPAKASPKKKKVATTTNLNEGFTPYDPKCDRCEKSNKECVRREAQDPGVRCTNCAKSKRGCSLTLKVQSKINFIPNDPICDRCERSHKECVRINTQDRGSRCKQCVKDHQTCKYPSKSQSKIKSKPSPSKAPKLMEEDSPSSSSSHNFDLELMQQQLKASQEDLRIAQQQLQLANSRIEAQRDLYEAQLAGYRGQGSGKVKQSYDRRNRV